MQDYANDMNVEHLYERLVRIGSSAFSFDATIDLDPEDSSLDVHMRIANDSGAVSAFDYIFKKRADMRMVADLRQLASELNRFAEEVENAYIEHIENNDEE